MNHKSFFAMAKEVALSKDDGRQFLHGAVGLRHDGVLVRSSNIKSLGVIPQCHAEARLIRKMDKGGIVYVVRVRKLDGTLTYSRPCEDCIRAMRRAHVKRAYYSISEKEYGVLDIS